MLALVLFLAPSLLQAPVARNGILNPGFDRILEVGELGNTSNSVDGAFWVGAEGKTSGAVNRWLELMPGKTEDLVYQRLACANGKQDTAKITGRVFVNAGDEARMTLGNGVLDYWSLDWVLEGPAASFGSLRFPRFSGHGVR